MISLLVSTGAGLYAAQKLKNDDEISAYVLRTYGMQSDGYSGSCMRTLFWCVKTEFLGKPQFKRVQRVASTLTVRLWAERETILCLILRSVVCQRHMVVWRSTRAQLTQ